MRGLLGHEPAEPDQPVTTGTERPLPQVDPVQHHRRRDRGVRRLPRLGDVAADRGERPRRTARVRGRGHGALQPGRGRRVQRGEHRHVQQRRHGERQVVEGVVVDHVEAVGQRLGQGHQQPQVCVVVAHEPRRRHRAVLTGGGAGLPPVSRERIPLVDPVGALTGEQADRVAAAAQAVDEVPDQRLEPTGERLADRVLRRGDHGDPQRVACAGPLCEGSGEGKRGVAHLAVPGRVWFTWKWVPVSPWRTPPSSILVLIR